MVDKILMYANNTENGWIVVGLVVGVAILYFLILKGVHDWYKDKKEE